MSYVVPYEVCEVHEVFDNYTAYEAKKKEVLSGNTPIGTQIRHYTANQEGCECATLELVDGTRVLTYKTYMMYEMII